MPDEMDTLLATQRARLAAGEREALIKRARGVPSAGALLFLGLGFLTLAAAAGLSVALPEFRSGMIAFLGLVNLGIGYHRMSNERLAAILALLDEEKHGPKEAWIRRIQQLPGSGR